MRGGGCRCPRLYQELWQTGKLYTYSVADFEQVQSVKGPLQDGWGATTDGKSLILSDGSASLTYVDPDTLAAQKTLPVRAPGCCSIANSGRCAVLLVVQCSACGTELGRLRRACLWCHCFACGAGMRGGGCTCIHAC